MREITVWRWVFGLALVPAALLTVSDLDTAGEAGAVEWIIAFAIACLVGLVLSGLAVGIAVWTWLSASRARRFISELLDLRD